MGGSGRYMVVFDAEQRVPKGHPLRRIKALADAALAQLSPRFDEMYSAVGRPSIPPERLLKASLLMALYTVRSERMFCEQLGYNFLFRWFLDIGGGRAELRPLDFLAQPRAAVGACGGGRVLPGGGGTGACAPIALGRALHGRRDLIEAWASLKSFRRKDAGPHEPPDDPGNPAVNFRGERRANATHQSTTDPEARLAKKGPGKEARLCYSANALMENRNTILIDFRVEAADGFAERRAAITMLDENLPGSRRITVAGDRGYDTRGFVASCRALRVTPHVARNQARPGGSALDARTVRHPGYAVSQWIRKQVEETFGWMKTVGGLRRTRYRGRARVQMHAYLVAAAYNLVRIANLSPAPA